MTIRYISGLDWSGDPGDPSRQSRRDAWIVAVVCHCAKGDLEVVQEAFNAFRKQKHLPLDYPFKHVRSTEATRNEFFRIVSHLPLTFTAHAIDERSWSQSYIASTSGLDRIGDLVRILTIARSHEYRERQVPLIDGDSGERGVVATLRNATRRACRERGIFLFDKISVVPDDRADAQLVQDADMVAGEIRLKEGGIPNHCAQHIIVFSRTPKPLA